MKTKLILLACISIVLASCKKDEAQLAQPQTQSASIEKQVADLIQKADKNLYDEMYNQSASRAGEVIEVNITRGIFRAQGGDIASGTCYGQENICHIEVVVKSGVIADSTDGIDEIPVGVLGSNETKIYTEEEYARVIVNTTEPIVENISELITSTDANGLMNVTFKRK